MNLRAETSVRQQQAEASSSNVYKRTKLELEYLLTYLWVYTRRLVGITRQLGKSGKLILRSGQESSNKTHPGHLLTHSQVSFSSLKSQVSQFATYRDKCRRFRLHRNCCPVFLSSKHPSSEGVFSGTCLSAESDSFMCPSK